MRKMGRFYLFLLVLSCFFLLIVPTDYIGVSSSYFPAFKHRQNTTSAFFTDGKLIIDHQGHIYTPYGVHSTALFEPDWQNSRDYKNFTLSQIQAAHTFWHANVITFQVARTNLFPDRQNSTIPDATYLSAMDTAVKWATQEQMNVIFNLQNEASSNEIMATSPDLLFWKIVANRYKSNQRVFFDVFNEPRDFYDWDLWQKGGVYNGVEYVGMQQLVDTIRATGAENLIFVQGQGAGESFDYYNFRNHLLTGENIVYAIHPYLSNTQHATRQDWNEWWGQAVQNLDVPFVIGEWNETPGSGCIANAPVVVPLFLSYVEELHIGLIAWALTPGALIRSNGDSHADWNWTNPTTFDTTSYTCLSSLNYPYFNPHAQGAGQLILQFLRTHAS